VRSLHETFALVRVIAGELGGRRLRAPRGLDTRPTSDRVREALFMSLEPLTGAHVIDLVAGSGAMGIEALSRGAARVDFVDSARPARAILEANLQELGLDARATVWPLSLPGGLGRLAERLSDADLILIDPPYGGALARATLEALGARVDLRTGGRVVVEHHRRDALPELCGVLVRARSRGYGETFVTTYVIQAPAPVAPDEGAQA
jgi:16S rRNA (guanine966-N2)-methyltransferase